ncbi:hypothetical protein FGIG_07122 [Fasciola gigantica]|uniref:Uncharacterized protein n=1 Tax=Fasciola gigantica TaxID=46835 RepID=A0A504WV65_FASGI|nr:hypothetical protein FGIG_07122 [Fasciola gigantica]
MSPTTPIPTPFQQASQLMGVTQRNGSIELVVNTPIPANSDRPPLVRSATDENDLPNPGITRNMVAKFSALYAT